MSEHEQRADELQEQSDRVGEEIAGAREEWERKLADDAVPGAVGAPRSESELPPPEPDETD
jgi:hypothetical protein